MKRKSLFLVILLSASQGQALWELPAAFLVGMAVKTPTGQWIAKLIFSKCKKVVLSRAPNVKIENPSVGDSTIQSDVRSGFISLGNALKGIALKSHVAMSSSLVAFLARAKNIQPKNPLTSSVETSTTEHTQVKWTSCEQPHVDQNSPNVGPSVNHFVKIDAKTLSQSTSGFFPKITNNYHSGVPEHVMAEAGKKQFWKGVSVGGFTVGTTLTWLHKCQEQKTH